MLKKSVAKYLCGTKEEILSRCRAVRDVKIAWSDTLLDTDSLRKLGIPNLPEAYPVLAVSETVIENLPRARKDIISLMTLSSRDGKYQRSVILVSATAPPGRLYGYFRELEEDSHTKR